MKKQRAALLARRSETTPQNPKASHATKTANTKAAAIDLKKLTWKQYLRLSAKFAKLSYKSFVQKHRVASRIIAIIIVLVMLLGVFFEIYGSREKIKEPVMSSAVESLIGPPVEQYASKITPDKDGGFIFNKEYKATADASGQSAGPKIKATFANGKTGAVSIQDPVNDVALTLKPKYAVLDPKKQANRVMYRIAGKDMTAIYSAKGSGVKEDIIIESVPKTDTLQFEYEVSLPDGVELRAEGDGSLAAYGVQSALLGNVSTGTEQDAELLKKARQNGEKSKLLFTLPAPFVVEVGKKQSSAKAWYSVQGTVVTLFASGLKTATYPLSIDPTIYVETARKFMRGNNETNVDFDTTNELIQKSQTTGARIDGWVDSVDMNAGLWDHSVAAAGGYVYRAGGRADPTMPYIAGQQASTQATDSTSFVMNMPTVRPAGDLYLAIIAHDGTGLITPPAGWTEYADNDANGGNTREHAAYYKEGTDQGGGNESASYTFTGSSEQWTGVILRIKGFNVGAPISTTLPNVGRGFNASDVVPVFPATTPQHDSTLVIRAAAVDSDQPSDYTWLPNGHTRVYSGSSSTDQANGAAIVVATLDQPPLATVTTGTQALASDGLLNDSYGASSIAIRPATVTTGYQNNVEWAQFNQTTLAIDSPNPGSGVCSGWCSDSVYNLPDARVGMSMIAYNGFLYALGGTPDGTAANATTTVWIAKLGANGEPQLWHPSGGTPAYWYVSSNTLPAALSYSSIAAYKNRLYLVGGRNTGGASSNDVRIADFLPTGDIGPWTTNGAQNLTTPLARFGHSVHVYNDTMYVIGGNNNGTLLATNYYSKLNTDGTMNAWVQTTSFTTARSSFGGQMTGVWGAYIYLAGGCSALTGGYCSTIANDVQLASINADGTLAPWNPILPLSNQRIGYSLLAWQGGLYRFGGCNRQNTTTGTCYASHRNAEYGAVNPAGDASAVRNSEPANTSLCSGSSPTNCDLPGAGDGAEQGGQMSSAIAINNGYIYVIGGCTSVADADVCETGGTAASSGNVMYAALDSEGKMIRPAVCTGGTYVTNSLWCVDSTRRINGTDGLSAASATVFNNTIYVSGGTTGANWQNDVWRVSLNNDGSLYGAWSVQDMNTNLGLTGTADDERGYMYTFTRANPAAAATNPGNFYMLGGCRGAGGAGDDGIGCGEYYADVIKCNITVSGALSSCSTSGQLQLDADNINAGNQGLGLMAGTVYANRIYLVGGACTEVGAADDPCGSTYSSNRKDTIYASIDGSNNIVASSGGVWQFTTGQMNPVRRRAAAFGYNGYIYSLAGYSGTASLQDLLFAKIDVSTGNMGNFESSGVVVTPRWDLRAIVSNGFVYAIGGCGAGAAPGGCTAMQSEVQTFQLYNNNSGTPIGYSASANQFATDRMGASSTILNGYLYVAGGCTTAAEVCTDALDSVQYSQIDKYGALSTWATGGSLPAARAWGQLENAGGSLYYIGGQSSTATDERAEVYYTTNISGGNPTWSGSAASNGLPAERTMHSASVWDNRIYVTGGLNNDAAAQATTYVSPRLSSAVSSGNITSAWTTTTAFTTARSGHTTIAYANNLYVLGGFNGTNYLNDVQYASIGYKTGTITQSGTSTITGSGTAWTSAMIGSTLQYQDGEIATILTVPSGTSMTVTVSKTVTEGTGYTILDGSLGSWSYSTSLPEPISQADGFAANGYMYLVGGRRSPGDCSSSTLQAPISANTTTASGNNATGVGEWYETNIKYSGERYGNSVSYSNGKLYVMGGACGISPAPISTTTQNFAADTTAHAVTMPATVDAGDLLIVLFTNDGDATVTTPAGWTAPANNSQVQGTQVRGSIFVKDANGTEDGTTVDFVTSAAEHAAAQVIRIPAAKWEGTIASFVIPTAPVAANSATQVPPSANPAGWGAENTLWGTYVAGSSYASVTTFSGQELGYHNSAGSGGTGASVSSALRQINVDGYEPSAYTMSGSSPGIAFTFAVRPPSTFTYTGANRTVQTALYSQPQVASYSRLIDTDTDVFPTSWLMNGLDNSIGARWQATYRSMHDINATTGGSDSVLTTPPSTYTLQQNPNEDCGTTATMATMTTWGRETVYKDVVLGDVAPFIARNGSVIAAGTITQSGTTVTGSGTAWTPNELSGGVLTYFDGTKANIISVDSSTQLTVSVSRTIAVAEAYSAGGGNINCARYYFFFVSIDASQTFGYPEDVNRGPTISDLTLYFTSDPSKRLRHGKTFTGGEQQPLETPVDSR